KARDIEDQNLRGRYSNNAKTPTLRHTRLTLLRGAKLHKYQEALYTKIRRSWPILYPAMPHHHHPQGPTKNHPHYHGDHMPISLKQPQHNMPPSPSWSAVSSPAS